MRARSQAQLWLNQMRAPALQGGNELLLNVARPLLRPKLHQQQQHVHLNAEILEKFKTINCFAVHDEMLPAMEKEIPAYLTRARDFTTTREDVSTFTTDVLKFWKSNRDSGFSTWAKAARMIFGLTPNSASCERVFSLLQQFYGDARDSSLADQIEASLKLAFNKRDVG